MLGSRWLAWSCCPEEWPSPSPMCAEAASVANPGIWPASSHTRPTAFRTFSPPGMPGRSGVSDGERIVAHGASAGGLLVGASLNLSPERFCAAVLDVPFVDVLRTMLNPELPLTTAEYSEWGNPNDPSVRQRLQAYSPLDNLPDRPWPPVFLQGSWHDTRVAYWEPAKLYARLSELAGPGHTPPPLLRIDMEAGHGGAPAGSRPGMIMRGRMPSSSGRWGKHEVGRQ